jgi:tetratricopeptide (TPR) repeat protein
LSNPTPYIGSAHHYRRKYEQAIHFHEQVLRISQEIGDRAIEAKAYAGLGHAARCMGDLHQAKRWHERQLDIGLATKDKLVEGQACSNLGIIYQLLGKSHNYYHCTQQSLLRLSLMSKDFKVFC